MNRSNPKEKSSLVFIGTGTIILFFVITSSLSFILGYFVGKNISSQTNREPVNVASQEITKQNNIPLEHNITEAQHEPNIKELQQIQGQKESLQNSLPKDFSQEKTAQQSSADKNSVELSEKEKAKGNAHIITKQELVENKTHLETKKNLKKTKYTVQVGAFKNSDDAHNLKTKLDKKGYKTTVMLFNAKNNANIYKVMVGEFNTRKEAEVTSVKLKKSEGLKSFVTFKSGLEEVR